MVTITTSVAPNYHDDIAARILRIVKQTPSLTFKPRKKIIAAIQSNNIALAFDGPQLVGWLIATPYSRSVQELGMAYLLPEYRNQGLLRRLIEALIRKRVITIAVTYEERIADHLVKSWNFRPSRLSELNKQTKRKFILSRMTTLSSIVSVIRHTTKSKPIYLIREGD